MSECMWESTLLSLQNSRHLIFFRRPPPLTPSFILANVPAALINRSVYHRTRGREQRRFVFHRARAIGDRETPRIRVESDEWRQIKKRNEFIPVPKAGSRVADLPWIPNEREITERACISN